MRVPNCLVSHDRPARPAPVLDCNLEPSSSPGAGWASRSLARRSHLPSGGRPNWRLRRGRSTPLRCRQNAEGPRSAIFMPLGNRVRKCTRLRSLTMDRAPAEGREVGVAQRGARTVFVKTERKIRKILLPPALCPEVTEAAAAAACRQGSGCQSREIRRAIVKLDPVRRAPRPTGCREASTSFITKRPPNG